MSDTRGGMGPGARKSLSLAVAGALALGIGGTAVRADDPPGLFGRLFRPGSQARRNPAPSTRGTPPATSAAPGSNSGAFGPGLLPPPTSGTPMTPASSLPAVNDTGAPPPARPGGPSAPSSGGEAVLGASAASASTGDLAPIRPQPRNTRAATEADPLFTRITLGRTNDGTRFGMFLQVYADGTIIDSEGVHRVGPDVLRGLAQALQNPELGRARGHCGGPPTDFVEEVHCVVYRRKLGGIVATNFSYSGNTAGCDPSIKALHTAVEALQAKLSSPGTAAPTEVTGNPPPSGPTFNPLPPVTAPATSPGSEVLTLTPGS